ncbi:alpha/beta hydrolase [Parvibaculum sp.]|uniref:alpha/beta hydrolase n=3 Tax=Parvibaculum sp. TaxID=2024848 RepID=UPI001B1B87BE|nr:alpha/beta hydrolase [Parvibaculum sp.]MBO6677042.1 alpha/beta hydrolase [Parvibaculum sp.]MBO6685981.1 alpha/beta hydrolase [Parvibaculum sp.]MBO6904383.1 alpha/beta hydrolase [Parvibaculum sp.]
MSLDPQAKALLDQLAADPDAPRLIDLPPEGGREMYRAMANMLDLQGVPIGKTEDRAIPGPASDIPVRIYTPVAGGGTGPALVYYHGGGWVIGDLDTHDALCRTLANEAGCKVIAVDYRLAPEHPFPAAIDDAFAAVKWVEANSSEIGIDPNGIAVAGDSAGGNLAAAVCLRAKAEKGPEIAFQLLIYPVTDAPRGTQSYKNFAEGYFLEAEGMDWFWNHYVLAAGADPKNPYAAPLRAESLSGLPPAYIVTAGFDVLRDEGKAYAEALKKAGVEVEYVNYEGMIHGFFNLQGALDVSREAVKAAAKALKEALA